MPLDQLNQLPVELFHQIFSYLSACDVFHAFHNLTDYLDAVLLSYDRYSINFRSVIKADFDVTCSFVRPHQIIALTLSDDYETPNQSELFFSLFAIEHFTNLRSFDMSSINNEICSKLVNMHKLEHLSSLELPRLFQPSCLKFDIVIKKLLPQLTRLMVYNAYYLRDVSLPHLRSLTLKHCSAYQLPTILHLMPNLHTLDVVLSLYITTNWFDNVPLMNQLRKLVLNSYSEKLTIVQIREFLSKMPNLTHFELVTPGENDLTDGERWEPIVSKLVLFDFRIRILNGEFQHSSERILSTFRSQFWIDYKQWLVAYSDRRPRLIYTVPRFASTVFHHPTVKKSPSCTLPDFNFDQYITSLHLFSPRSIPDCFINVSSITVDSSQIMTEDGLTMLSNLTKSLPKLYSISFQDASIFDYIPNHMVFNTIRALQVRTANQHPNIPPQVNTDRLCKIFPRIERLNIELPSLQHLLILIDQLKYLSIAKFGIGYVISAKKRSSRSFTITHDWLLLNSTRLKANNNFTYRFISDEIHLWMNNEKVRFLLHLSGLFEYLDLKSSIYTVGDYT